MEETLSSEELAALPSSLRKKLQDRFASLAEAKAEAERHLHDRCQDLKNLQKRLLEASSGLAEVDKKRLESESKLLRNGDELIQLVTSLRESRLEAGKTKLLVTKLTGEKANMSNTITQQREKINRLEERLAAERAEVSNLVNEKCALEIRLIEVNGQLVRGKELEQRFAALVDSTNAERTKHQEELLAVSDFMADVRQRSNEHCFKAEAAQMSYAKELGALKIENDSLKLALKLSRERAEKLEARMLESQKRHRLEMMEYVEKIFDLECSIGDDMKAMQQYYEKVTEIKKQRNAAIQSMECNRRIVKHVVSHASRAQKEYELQLTLKDKLIAQLTSELRLFLQVGDGTIAHTVALDTGGTGQTEIRAVTFTTLYHEYWLLVKMLLVTKAKFQLLKQKFKSVLTLKEAGRETSLESELENQSVNRCPSRRPELAADQSESTSTDLSTALAFELPNLVEGLNEPVEEDLHRGPFTYADEEGFLNQQIRTLMTYRKFVSSNMVIDDQGAQASTAEAEVPFPADIPSLCPFGSQPFETAIASWKELMRVRVENARLAEECRCCSDLLANQEERYRSLNATMESLMEIMQALQSAVEEAKASEAIAQRRCERLEDQLAAEGRFRSFSTAHNAMVAQSLSDARSEVIFLEKELSVQAASFHRQNKLADMVSGLTASLENIQKSSLETLGENLAAMTSRQESLVDAANEAARHSEETITTSNYYVQLFRSNMQRAERLKRRAMEQAYRHKRQCLGLKRKVEKLLNERRSEGSETQGMRRLQTKISSLTVTLRRQNARLSQVAKKLRIKDAEVKYWKELSESSERSLGAKEKERHSLESQLQEQVSQRIQLSDQAGQLARAVEEAKAQAEIRTSEHSNLLDEVYGRLASVTEQMNVYQAEMDKSNKEAEALRSERDSLQHAVETLSSEIAEARSQNADSLAQVKAEAASLEALIKEKEEQLNEVKKEATAFRAKFLPEYMALVDELKECRKTIADFDKVKEQFFSRLSAPEEPSDEGSTSTGKPEVDLLRFMEEERRVAVERSARAEAELLRSRLRVSELEKRLRATKDLTSAESDTLKVEIAGKKEEIDALNSRLREASESIAALRAELDRAKAQKAQPLAAPEGQPALADSSGKPGEKPQRQSEPAASDQREKTAPYLESLKLQSLLKMVNQQLKTVKSLELLTDKAEGLFDRVSEVVPPAKVGLASSIEPDAEVEHPWAANVAKLKEALKELRCEHQKLRDDCGIIMSSSQVGEGPMMGHSLKQEAVPGERRDRSVSQRETSTQTGEPANSLQPDQPADIDAGSPNLAAKREHVSPRPEPIPIKRSRAEPEIESADPGPALESGEATAVEVERPAETAGELTSGPVDADSSSGLPTGDTGASPQCLENTDQIPTEVSTASGDLQATRSTGEMQAGQRKPIVWDANGGERRPVPVLTPSPRLQRREPRKRRRPGRRFPRRGPR